VAAQHLRKLRIIVSIQALFRNQTAEVQDGLFTLIAPPNGVSNQRSNTMKTLGKLVLGTALIGTFSLAHADNFVGVTWGETSNNMQKSRSLNAQINNPDLDGAINNSGTWGARVGTVEDDSRFYFTYDYVSDTRNQFKLRQQNLLVSYDLLLPVGNHGTQLFGGVSGGLTRVELRGGGFSSDSDVDLAGGVQVGIIQRLDNKVAVEGGYRYLRTNADVRLKERGTGSSGRADLHSSEQFYIGLNYRF
jgi:hypothetical protein